MAYDVMYLELRTCRRQLICHWHNAELCCEVCAPDRTVKPSRLRAPLVDPSTPAQFTQNTGRLSYVRTSLVDLGRGCGYVYIIRSPLCIRITK